MHPRLFSRCLTLSLMLCARCWADPFSFVAVGDIPYDATQIAEFSRSIEHIGAMDAKFVIHVGDIKAGKAECNAEIFDHRFAMYDACKLPFVVLVGDNDFNDCADPDQALQMFRERFASGPTSIGRKRMPVERQGGPGSQHDRPEHVRWIESGCVFIGLNVVGSANNYSVTEEWKARTEAGIAWLAEGFKTAAETNAAAVVVAFQANPFRDLTTGPPFAPIMDELVRQAEAFKKPVLFIHGDSHYFRWDIPFRSKTHRGVMTNLSRLEVFGSPNPHWVEVKVDPAAPGVFSVHPHFLPRE